MAALMAVALFAACGGDDDDDASSDDTEATTDDTAAATDSTAAGDDADAEWQAVVDAAKEEGELVVYSATLDEQSQALIDGFMAEYPEISASFIRLTSGPQVERLDQELAANSLGGDIAWHTDIAWWTTQVEAGTLTPVAGPNTANWSEGHYADGVVTAFIVPFGVTYNTSFFDTPPETWDDLFIDEAEGRVAIPEPITTAYVALYEMLDEEGLLGRMGDFGGAAYVGDAPMIQSVASGENVWVPGATYSQTKPLADEGAPVEWFIPPDRTLAIEVSMGGLKDAAHPNAARLFLDYVMSEEGQGILVNGTGNSSVLGEIPGVPNQVPLDKDLVQEVDWSLYDEAKLAEVRATFDELFR